MTALYRLLMRVFLCLCGILAIAEVRMVSGAPPVDAAGRPLIERLGVVAIDQIENSPVVFNGKLYLFEARPSHYVDCETGKTYPLPSNIGPPGPAGRQPYYFTNAFVDGGTVYVTATRTGYSATANGPEVFMWTSTDLVNWSPKLTALNQPGFTFYNTSICKAKNKFVMMLEFLKPVEQSGGDWSSRFATSTDLLNWTLTPPEYNYGKGRYAAPHTLRYSNGYYYNFYLEQHTGAAYSWDQRVVRSKDLIHWESSPLNPVLAPSADDRKILNPNFTPAQRAKIAAAKNVNNSDMDFCEYQGRVVIYYCWGDQSGELEHHFQCKAVYQGTEADFLQGWFPASR